MPGRNCMRDFWEQKPGALRRLGEQARWWEMTYRDWLSLMPVRGRLWDIGCGFGQFKRVARDCGLASYGVEPSRYAVAHSVADTRYIFPCSWQEYAPPRGRGAAISALWLMEHLDKPGDFLDWAHAALVTGGMLLAVVPNENTPIQRAANSIAAKKDWWIHQTHLNYWGKEAFEALLFRHGFECFDVLGTYPMEEFILAGMDYTDNPDVGRACHKKVEDMEMAMTRDGRLRWGRARARLGRGRDLVVFARKR